MKQLMIKRLASSAAARYTTVGAFIAFLGLPAHAALPAAVTDAITAAGADMVAAMTAIIVAFVAFWGLKKLASKFGWA